MIFRQRAILFAATGCHIGYVPFAPGTFGTLLGLPICYLWSHLEIRVAVLALLPLIAISMVIAGAGEALLKKKDPGVIVIDEIIGIMVALVGLPMNMATLFIGFLLFRFLDITKPFPIRFIERRTSGGFGIVLDDVLAGLACNATIRLVLMVIH